ncbi:hypothetical protein [Sphingomonas sp.]|uniref:hypothetical protein n=1 Tax=Sphingomonas sp. TaxID=28214 RepID=UPI0028AB4671|nr:hypothetical protein [Sphingomonas sp.]
MTAEEEMRAFLIAEELIEQFGDAVHLFLGGKILETQPQGNIEQMEAWLVIREAALTVLEACSRPMH